MNVQVPHVMNTRKLSLQSGRRRPAVRYLRVKSLHIKDLGLNPDVSLGNVNPLYPTSYTVLEARLPDTQFPIGVSSQLWPMR